ncbi:hypothetical protein HBI07_250260 [Parastagonospora nodorum]|nr:hypothetical protein HBI84_248290 [Parastagonospora nodorum]KAH6516371.1 hypothetical protein HBI07_250260 [Parastagonospora nodorum]
MDTKLEAKLKTAHPELPGFVIDNLYGGLFADRDAGAATKLGRINLSLFAIGCLRAQQGAEAQLVGHILGLQKAADPRTWSEGSYTESEDATYWLRSDEGCTWLLKKVDELVAALDRCEGSISTVSSKAKM